MTHVVFALPARPVGQVLIDDQDRLVSAEGPLATEDVPGPLADCIHPSARATLSDWLAQRRAGTAAPELRGLPLNVDPARMAWVDLTLQPELAPSGPTGRLLGECQDATSRVLAERFDQLYWPALELLPSASVITEAHSPHRVVYANPAFEVLTGYAKHEMCGQSCTLLQGEERDQPVLPGLREALRAGLPYEGVLHNYRKDGTAFWNHLRIAAIRDPATGWITHFWSVQTDVTLKRERMEALSQLSQELKSLFQDTPVGLVSFDPQGLANLVNPACADLTSLTLEGMDRATVLASLAPWRLKEEDNTIFTGAAAGVCHIRVPGVRPRILELSTGTHGKSGTFDILVIRDVTAEHTVSQMKTEFLSSAAHELRAPLASIQGFAELMQMRGHLSPAQLSMMETIVRQSRRMTDLLNDLLDLTRIEAQLPGQMDIGEVDLLGVAQCAVDDQSVLSERHRFVIQADLCDWLVYADEVKLEQVLVNLLSNARKYSPQGGDIEVGLTRDIERGRIGLSVRDRGIGMTPEAIGHLFTRFFRVHPNGEVGGTGLGLCIVHELVERMQGQIDIESEPGKGSVFTVWLPAVPTASALAA
ncbi:PAS domain-containing sensor histidine kinase [Roseateles amylovorans]|uniref:histidine kinase n=1 Tax=Roseateles amylovorans TaxID=2978473 RepID=A0ABY6B0B9_9BURK|nr:ATP-binding protein [Roseateles amylovorans]UXH76775.1 ATP-binding protein [Roseateles amylovorans]